MGNAIFGWGYRRVGFLIALLLISSVRLGAAETYASLTVGGETYYKVVVSSVTANALIVRHARGIAQLPLAKLSKELQVKYGYSEESAAKREEHLARVRSQQVVLKQKHRQQLKESRTRGGSISISRSGGSTQERAYRLKFGEKAELLPEVDLRKNFIDLDLHVRSQGQRPSCSVFAIVSALEYQNAVATETTEAFSEEYLIWATCKTLGRFNLLKEMADAGSPMGWDAGFTLTEVAQALETYGILLRSEAPYKQGGNWMNTAEGGEMEALVGKAKARSSTRMVRIPGREPEVVISNLIHVLNTNTPVVIGANWPSPMALRNNPTLSVQEGQGGHAVTLVGYKNKTGKLEDVTFIFRNSWGRKWGSGGYGFIRYEYLMKNVGEAIVIELD